MMLRRHCCRYFITPMPQLFFFFAMLPLLCYDAVFIYAIAYFRQRFSLFSFLSPFLPCRFRH